MCLILSCSIPGFRIQRSWFNPEGVPAQAQRGKYLGPDLEQVLTPGTPREPSRRLWYGIYMSLTISIPDDLAAVLGSSPQEREKRAREAIALELYREGKISLRMMGELVGVGGDYWAAENFRIQYKVPLNDSSGEVLRRSVNPGNQPADLRGVPVVIGKLLSQPALFAPRFGIEQHGLKQRQGHALPASPQAGPTQTKSDQARVNGMPYQRVDPVPDELRLPGRLREGSQAFVQHPCARDDRSRPGAEQGGRNYACESRAGQLVPFGRKDQPTCHHEKLS